MKTSSQKHGRCLGEFDYSTTDSTNPALNVHQYEHENIQQLDPYQFCLNPNEIAEMTNLRKRLFFYNLKNHCLQHLNPPSLTIPSFKVKFFQEDKPTTEQSKVFYLGCLNLHADNKDTVLKVLNKLTDIF